MEKNKKFIIFIGQLGLGKYSEEEKKEFLEWINKELEKRSYGEELKPFTNKNILIKGSEDILSRTADIITIIGFSYWLLPSNIKKILTVDYFIEKAKQWIEEYKNN